MGSRLNHRYVYSFDGGRVRTERNFVSSAILGLPLTLTRPEKGRGMLVSFNLF